MKCHKSLYYVIFSNPLSLLLLHSMNT